MKFSQALPYRKAVQKVSSYEISLVPQLSKQFPSLSTHLPFLQMLKTTDCTLRGTDRDFHSFYRKQRLLRYNFLSSNLLISRLLHTFPHHRGHVPPVSGPPKESTSTCLRRSLPSQPYSAPNEHRSRKEGRRMIQRSLVSL